MKYRVRIGLVAGLLGGAALFAPTFVMAQASRGSSVGIVTTLNGQATVTRADRPAQSVPLKFKDEVYFKDRISTKEHSIARVLLGGKSLVTVRELSDLTITEEPGRPSILDLFGGKIALAVAKLRMRPGESIEVRTPNAVAAVRGTVLVAEVTGGSNSEAKPRLTSFHPGAAPVQSKDALTTFYNISTSPDSFVDVAPLSGKTATFNGVTLGVGEQVSANDSGLFGKGPTDPVKLNEMRKSPGGTLKSGGTPDQLKGNFVNTTASTFNPQALQSGGGSTGPLIINVINPLTGCEPHCPTGGGGGGGGGGGINFSDSIVPCDDCNTVNRFSETGLPNGTVPLGFNFPFKAGSVDITSSNIVVSSNGFLYLVGPGQTGFENPFLDDGCCSGNSSGLRNGAPRIAPFWTDLLPAGQGFGAGTVTFTAFPGAARVSWNNVQEFERPSSNTFHVDLLSNGQIIFMYSSIDVTGHTALVGVSQGGEAAEPGPTVFSRLTTPTHNPGTNPGVGIGTVYQTFDLCGECDTFDLIGTSETKPQGMFILFDPDGVGGWNVTDPPPTFIASLGPGEVVVRDRPLLEAEGGTQLLIGGAALIENGQLIVTDPRPLVSLSGGTHHIGIFPGTALFILVGQDTAIDGETGLEVGTHQPLVHAGEMLHLTGATARMEQLVRVDRALLEATAPLLNLMNQEANRSTLVSNNDLVNLTNHAKLSANLLPNDALVKLNASSLAVYNGSLVNVANSSVFNLTGNLVSLANSSFLNILNGGLLNVSGNSVANITGSLVSFLGAGNSLTVNNSFAPTAIINGIPVFTSGGATISITNPTPITGTGTQNIHGSLIIAQGAGTTVTIR